MSSQQQKNQTDNVAHKEAGRRQRRGKDILLESRKPGEEKYTDRKESRKNKVYRRKREDETILEQKEGKHFTKRERDTEQEIPEPKHCKHAEKSQIEYQRIKYRVNKSKPESQWKRRKTLAV